MSSTSSPRHGPLERRLPCPPNAIKQHHAGPEETGDGVWSPDLGAVLLRRIAERTMKVHGRPAPRISVSPIVPR